MAAVAREPGAAAVLTIPTDPDSSTPGLPLVLSDPVGPRQSALFPEKDESCADRRHVTAATNASTEANVSAELTQELTKLTQPNELTELRPLLRESAAGKAHSDSGPGAESDPVQSAVSPLSLPAAPEAPEAGLSLGQPNGPDRGCTERTMSGSPDRTPADSERRFAAVREPLARDLRDGVGEDSAQDSVGPAESEPELRPGTQVQVSLDHVIDDALVVSFRVGHKVFSGVLMDLSRRFGPYGIPITAFPPRRESSRRHAPLPVADPAPAAEPASTPQDPASPAVTPLFHVGAPYPPPLFLRDSYHQSMPQPPPRRIKRSRRRYTCSEEPTCMLVRLRPRQVLCDRCKGAAGPRAPPTSTQRRRTNTEPIEENMSAEVKRLRGDESRPSRLRREGPKRDRQTSTSNITGLRPGTRAGTSGTRAGTSSASGTRPGTSGASSTRHGTSSASGLRPGGRSTDSSIRPGTSLRSRTSPSPGSGSSRVLTRRIASALAPPRIRLKPHRYRTDTEPGPQPPTKNRPRPGSTRTEPLTQRTTKNSTKNLNTAQSRQQGRPQARPRTRPGTRQETVRTEPDQDPKPKIKPELKPTPGTSLGQDQVNALSENKRLETKPEIRNLTDGQTPELPPEQHTHRSRRKQVFPRPTRDYDLDFILEIGPDLSAEPGIDPRLTVDSFKPEPALNSNADCDKRPGPKSKPGQLQQGPGLGSVSHLALLPKPGVETKADPSKTQCPRNEPENSKESKESNEGNDSWVRPGPESNCSPLEPSKSDPEPEMVHPGSNPNPVASEQINSSSDPDPHLDPNPGLDSEASLTGPDLTVHSRFSSKSKSGSVIDSRPSSPASSSASSGSSRSRSRSRSISLGQFSTRSKPESSFSSTARPECSPASNTDHSPAPCSTAPSSDHGPAPTSNRSASSRAVSKVFGADGRGVCVGDIVWAKIAGFPWWPARVLSLTVRRRGDGPKQDVKQEVRVGWFGSRTTSLLPLSHTSSFLETFQSRFDRKRKGPYRRAIGEAASAAKQLTPEVRALLMQFETQS